jgi:hypothetical protein
MARSPQAEPAPGCALLMARGLAAWLEVAARVAPPPRSDPRAALEGPAPRDLTALTGRSALTHVLATLVLAYAQEEGRV